MRTAVLVFLAALASVSVASGQTDEPFGGNQQTGYATNVTATDLTPTSAKVSWTWHLGCSPQVSLMSWQSDGIIQLMAWMNATEGHMEVELPYLYARTTYTMGPVPSETCGGSASAAAGSPQRVTFATPHGAGYATQVHVDNITTTTATVHWSWVPGCEFSFVDILAIPLTEPAMSQGSPGTSVRPPADPSSNPRQADIDRLVPGTDYAVRIEPRERCGECCVPEPQATFRTLGETPPSPDEDWHYDPHMGWAEDFHVDPASRSATFWWDWTPGCAETAELRVYEDADGELGDLAVLRLVDAAEDGPHEYEVEGLEPGTDYWGHVVVPHQCGVVGGTSDYVPFRTQESRVGAGLGASLALIALVAALTAFRRRP